MVMGAHGCNPRPMIQPAAQCFVLTVWVAKSKHIVVRWQEGLMAFITKPEVEKKNVQRVILKAGSDGGGFSGNAGVRYLLNFVVVQMHLDNLNAGHE